MSRTWLLFLICLFLLIFLAPLSRASLTVRVDDSATRIFFAETGTKVVLPVENALDHPVDAHVKLELLDPDGVTRATVERDCQISRGRRDLTFPIALSLTGKSATSTRELLWYRLRYQIAPASSAKFDRVANVISLSEITPDIFTVNVASARKAHEGSPYRLRVKTAHPLTGKPVAGVNIEGQMTFDGDDRADVVLKQSARTDASGFATLDFQIPRALEDDEGKLEVTARRGVLLESAETDVELDRETQIMVSTDKPLYQPGQIVHTRILMFDSSRHALSGDTATIKISDPESSTAFRADVTSSRFGVAGADWQIPENIRLGNYSVEVKLTSGKYEDAYGAATLKISRYDLPNFTVNVKPDRPYYLPNQNAEVEVRADYLFGQPVKRGHVRVVRETERRWNYREQKYETEEGDKYEGETDGDGRFVARINLSEEHQKLKEEDYSRYTDLTYAAYFTDPTNNRTEERRFDLRVTKDGIHIYVLAPRGRQARDFPLQLYVSTSYADGTPASCEMAIKRVWDKDDHRPEVPLGVVKTNRYGLAKIDSLTIHGSDDNDEVQLLFSARDDRNQTGQHTESIELGDSPVVRITTDKPLYRDGEPIRAEITSNKSDLTLALDAITEENVVQSQLVSLKNGRAAIVIPYKPAFTGTVTLAAYALSDTDDEDDAAGTRTVLYPHDRDLKLNLALSRESYRPGDDASASFLTRLAKGRPAESALGVVILDKAVEERARTDRDFGGGYGFYRAYRYLSNDSGDVAGITRKDLDRLDLSKPLPDGLNLVAEVLLTNYMFAPHFFHSDRYSSDAAGIFRDFIEYEIDPLKDRLNLEYKTSGDYPTSEDALRRFAMTAGVAFDELRDPWETPYRTSFFAQGASDVLQIASAGRDKRFDTDDDFTVLRIERPYFRFAGEAIDRAVARFHTTTGQFIRDAATLKNELRHEGIDLDSLRDPWGQPYRLDFKINQTKFQILVSSSGPDKQFAPKSADDFALWTSSIDYSAALQARIDTALVTYFKNTSQFPRSDAELNTALKQSQLTRDDLRDPWGNPYYSTFQQRSVYGDRVNIYNYANYGDQPKERTELTPVTQQMTFLNLRSRGEDGKENTPDDFTVATFSRLLAEQAGNESSPQPVKSGPILPGSRGAITGTVTDSNGAAVAGAKITAKNVRTMLEYMAETADEGTYLVKNLPAGNYQVTVDASAFQRTVIANVFVRSSGITRLDVSLNVGGVSETVTVSAGAAELTTVNTTSTQMSSTINGGRNFTLDGVNVVTKSGASVPNQLATPRLREYFPETLVWQPSLETDKQGRAQLKFKLADNITTWKMSVIGSTEDGQIGIAEKEIKAFQPFFVDHDPPRILTEGDEISLPVVVRNYLASAQSVNLQMKPESWFTLLGPATENINVAAGDAARGIFVFRAGASVKDGKQRITATASEANDAIEKPVTVHPDGEEKSVSASDIVSDQASLALDIPTTAIPNSISAQLKIYPNLLANVTESVEAIMSRPYGCGEQTISSTYPSLLWLKSYRRMGAPAGAADLHMKADKYLRAGYARLLNYQDESGGFTYWGRGEPDVALTAYALRFLSEASELAPVDDDIIIRTRDWLIKQQRADGSWAAHDYWDKTENSRRTAILTAYVARVLATTDRRSSSDGQTTAPPTATGKKVSATASALKRALDFVGARASEIDEPYLIASYTLALIDGGDRARAGMMVAKLRSLARAENGAAYWALETNTPFYGWGLAGRIETTALVVQALARFSQAGNASAPRDELTDRGLLFLLREKDRYGIWYSTQATINVLDALLALLAREVNGTASISRTAEILVNGRSVKSIDLPEANRLVGPVYVDLTPFTQAGQNRVEIRRARGSSPASVQAVAIYYLPWRESVATQEANWRANGSSGLRLVTKFDKTEGAVSDEMSCHVEAERIGFKGYGMMLAEIGLPPGSDVDRASLETAMKRSDWSISQYDVLPDRVVIYLWPRAGGTKFDFKFKPRFGLKAQTAASMVYDYYNPEARAIVEPVRFVIK